MQTAAPDNSFSSSRPAVLHGTRRSYATQLLDNRNLAHLDRTAELVAQGEIVAFGFNGVFAFIGDADQPVAARRIALAKGQSMDKTLALVCPPEQLGEFIDPDGAAFEHHDFGKLQTLQRGLHGLGLILPAAQRGLPAYATENGTVLNVWFEYAPARYLYQRLRALGVRVLAGSSANRHGESTYVDPLHAMRVFGGSIPAIVAHDTRDVPAQRRQSSTLVDFTQELPRLVRRGSVPVEELRTHLRRLGMADLCEAPEETMTSAPVLH